MLTKERDRHKRSADRLHSVNTDFTVGAVVGFLNVFVAVVADRGFGLTLNVPHDDVGFEMRTEPLRKPLGPDRHLNGALASPPPGGLADGL